MAENPDAAMPDRIKTRDQGEQRALACAVETKENGECGWRNRKGHVDERLTRSIAMAHALDGQRRTLRDCHSVHSTGFRLIRYSLPNGTVRKTVLLLPGDCNAPWQLANLDAFDYLQIGHIDDRNVIRYSVGGQKIFLVRRKRSVPNALSNEKIFLHRMGFTINHSDAIGWAERHEPHPPVSGNADSHRLDSFLPQSRYLKRDLALYLVLGGIDDGYCSADFGGNPQLRAVTLELSKARARIDEHVRDDLARLRIDEMHHVGGCRSVDEDLSVGTHAHAFRLDSHLHIADAGAARQVDDGDGVVILVRHVEELAGWILREQLGIRTRGQIGHYLMRGRIDHLHCIVISDRNQNELSVLGQLDAAWSLTHLDRAYDRELLRVHYAYGIAPLVRNVGGKGACFRSRADQQPDAKQRAAFWEHSSFPITSACIWSRADPRRACRAPTPDAESLPAERLKLRLCRH